MFATVRDSPAVMSQGLAGSLAGEHEPRMQPAALGEDRQGGRRQGYDVLTLRLHAIRRNAPLAALKVDLVPGGAAATFSDT